ncbi:hypothetical protein AMS68_006982 [Peltaster fructicola]|uniref:NTF2-like domain-containing protein n=1 Tax=Peltaster fructicola TaxID=286661 RepID=A0A6H0Y3F5_9PEZI|nr:hypothetical protein AMS68_006982 [Peltaster fructicola]
MKSFVLATLTLLAVGISAIPQAPTLNALTEVLARSDLYARDDNAADGFSDSDGNNCLTAKRAQQVAVNFRTLITNYTESMANASLTVDFTDYSDSVNELIDNGCPSGPRPLGSATFTSRANFEQLQAGQPQIPFKQLNIWHTCHAVIIRWVSNMSPNIVTGIIVIETVPAPSGSKYMDLIKLVYSELNSGAWLYNLGVFKPTCS